MRRAHLTRDGIEPLKDVVTVAATNRPDLLVRAVLRIQEARKCVGMYLRGECAQDAALLRPGRIDRILYIGPPDEPSRLAILRLETRRMPLAADVQLDLLASQVGAA
jgi:SpoVK/Ycf46/Vps4 family AAA+-type ATPase